MSVLLYMLERLPWAGVGLLGGYFLGLHLRRTEAAMAGSNGRKWRPNGTYVFGVILVLLGVGTAIQGVVQSRATDGLTQCIATYSNGLADAIEARSRASSEAQRASDDFWRALYALPQNDEGRAQARKVFEEYVRKREASNRAQAENPYPAPPRAVC